MYSRYTPNASGGFDRRQLPDEADLRAAQGRAPPADGMQNADSRMHNAECIMQNEETGKVGAHSVRPPGPPPPPILGGLLGPGGVLGQLLPHGLDTEDLLILAILLLSMKQDGASPTELLIAVGLYLWL